jgi:hypothetical protein
MLSHILKTDSVFWIFPQTIQQKALKLIGRVNPLSFLNILQPDFLIAYFPFQLTFRLALEGQKPIDDLKEHDSHGPDIAFDCVDVGGD